MMKRVKHILGALLAGVLCLTMLLPISVWAAEGTQGTEMQVMQPEQLEIQLGANWAGVEFQLKTDAGLYPGTIPVGADGILKLEIGGSSSYILTCMNSTVSVPKPADDAQALATTEGENQESVPATTEEIPPATEEGGSSEAGSPEKTVGGIPVSHLVMFGGGMVLAVGTLVGMYIAKRRSQYDNPDEDLDEDDD